MKIRLLLILCVGCLTVPTTPFETNALPASILSGEEFHQSPSNLSSPDTLLAQRLLHQYLSVAKIQKTTEEGQSANRPKPIKCFTPVVKRYEQLRSGISRKEQQYLDLKIKSRPLQNTSTDSLLSPSGKFELTYTTTGEDSVPATDRDNNGTPDYIEWAAQYADSTWHTEIRQLKYPDPLARQGEPYQIYFVDTDFYGSTYEVQDGSGTYMEVNNNFKDFPPNTDPEGDRKGALKVTIAHEFKHAINYYITHWQGEVDQWAEMDATLMEELVYDQVNDYYNYLTSIFSIFNAPGVSMYGGDYEHVSFAIYFTETFGPLFWSDIWKNIIESGEGARSLPMIPAIDTTLQTYSSNDFNYHYTRNHLWHFASGSSRVTQNFGFEERFAMFQNGYAYPPSNLTYNHDSLGIPDSLSDWRNLSNLSAHHISNNTAPSDHGPVQIRVKYDTTEIGVGLIAYTDGGVKTQIKTSRNKGSLSFTPGWWWGRINTLGLVVTNPDPNRLDISYRIEYGTLDRPLFSIDLPDQPKLKPNYPNPFNQSTTLSFVLPHTQDVTIRVYNTVGRLVRTLQRNRVPAGPHTIQFDASNLASGVYMYQLITEGQIKTGKMTLLK